VHLTFVNLRLTQPYPMSVLLRRLSTPISARGKQDARHLAVDAVSCQIDWAAVSRFFVVDGDEQASHACRDRRTGGQSRPDVNRRLVQPFGVGE
jgi:hypothetical protein